MRQFQVLLNTLDIIYNSSLYSRRCGSVNSGKHSVRLKVFEYDEIFLNYTRNELSSVPHWMGTSQYHVLT